MQQTIAVVDDNEIACTWLSEVLKEAGFAVVTYSNSFGIQAFVRQSKPALLILDVNMPALSGKIVCNLLKEDPKTCALSIILYSSMNIDELKAAALQCRADGYLTKSNDGKPVVAHVKALLRSSNAAKKRMM